MSSEPGYKIDKYVLKLKNVNDPYKANIYQNKIKYYNKIRLDNLEKQGCNGYSRTMAKYEQISENLILMEKFLKELSYETKNSLSNFGDKNELVEKINNDLNGLNNVKKTYEKIKNLIEDDA